MATRNIVPRANGEGSIGTAVKHWGNGYFDELNIEKLVANDVIAKGPIVDVRAFGAKGDGVTDDTAALQAAIDYATTVFFESGKTYLSQRLEIPSNRILNLNTANLQQKGSDSSYIFISIKGAANVTVCNGTIIGNYGNVTSPDEFGHCICATIGASNVVLSNLKVINAVGDGINISVGDISHPDAACCENVYIDNIVCENNGRCDLALTGAKKVIVKNLVLQGGKRYLPKCAIDLEPVSANYINENVVIENVVHNGDTTGGLHITWLSKDIRINNVKTNTIIGAGEQSAFIDDVNCVHDLVISNCCAPAIRLQNCINSIVENNIITGVDGSSSVTFGYNKNSIFKDNIIYCSNNAQRAVIITTNVDCLFTKNTIQGTPTSTYIYTAVTGVTNIELYKVNNPLFIVSDNIIFNTANVAAITTCIGGYFKDNIITRQDGILYADPELEVRYKSWIVDTPKNCYYATNSILRYCYLKKGDSIFLGSPNGNTYLYYCATAGYYSSIRRANATQYKYGDCINNSGYVYECVVTSGTSDVSAPIFDTTVGNETNDGTVVWKCLGTIAVLRSAELTA